MSTNANFGWVPLYENFQMWTLHQMCAACSQPFVGMWCCVTSAVWVGVRAYMSITMHAWGAVWECHIASSPTVCRGISKMGVALLCFLKDLIVSRPLNCFASDLGYMGCSLCASHYIQRCMLSKPCACTFKSCPKPLGPTLNSENLP